MKKAVALTIIGIGISLSASFAKAVTDCPHGEKLLCRNFNPDDCVCVFYLPNSGHSPLSKVMLKADNQTTNAVIGSGKYTFGGMHACDRRENDSNDDYREDDSNACDSRAEGQADMNAGNECGGNAVRISDYSCSTSCLRTADTFGTRTNYAKAQYQCVNR